MYIFAAELSAKKPAPINKSSGIQKKRRRKESEVLNNLGNLADSLQLGGKSQKTNKTAPSLGTSVNTLKVRRLITCVFSPRVNLHCICLVSFVITDEPYQNKCMQGKGNCTTAAGSQTPRVHFKSYSSYNKPFNSDATSPSSSKTFKRR